MKLPSRDQTRPKRRTSSWPEIGLLLLYLAVRLYRLDHFPLFIDEAFHIAWGREVWAFHPFLGVPDGKALIPIVAATLWPFENALWVSRAVIVLIGLLGLTGLLALGRSLVGFRTARWATVVWIVLPYAFFFERLVLADSLGASLVLLSGALVIHALRRMRRVDAVLGGAVLALVVLSKLSMLVYVALPLVAWALIARRRDTLKQLASIYFVMGAILILYGAVSTVAGYSSYGAANAKRFTSFEVGSLIERLSGNIYLFVEWMTIYWGPVFFALFLLAAIWSLVRPRPERMVLLTFSMLPILEFCLLSTYPVPRYYLPATGPALLLAIALLVSLRDAWRAHRYLAAVVHICIVASLLIPGIVFIATSYWMPSRLQLAEPDTRDYIWHSTSGFGLVDGVEWLETQSKEHPITVICSDGITCHRLSIYLGHRSVVQLARTDVLSRLWVTEQHAAGKLVLLAEDRPGHTASPFDPGPEYQLIQRATFSRPYDRSAFIIYELRPVP